MASLRERLAGALALNRTVAVVLLSVLFFGLGEQLWSPFLPVYLEASTKQLATEAASAGAVPAAALWLVAFYVLARNVFEAVCYIGGGRITAALGDRGSLLLFGFLTLGGYALFLFVDDPRAAVLAALLILAWEPLSVPVTFTTVGATVSRERRGLAFALQSIQKRLPKMIGPVIAGFVLAAMERAHGPAEGRIAGMRLLVGAALGLALVTLAMQWRWMPHREADDTPVAWRAVWAAFPPTLRSLLLAEICTRWCDWLVREFVVLYLVFVRGVSVADFALLTLLQHSVALLTYLPIGRLTQTFGLRPFVGLTFVFFALFPLTLALVPDAWLPLAFVVYGLREIGEPARKALITTNLPKEVRARGVGLYWGLRAAAIGWAGLVGAACWLYQGPEPLLYIAFALGVLGAFIYYCFCPPESEGESKR